MIECGKAIAGRGDVVWCASGDVGGLDGLGMFDVDSGLRNG